MVAQALERQVVSGHIRPFVPHRDMAGLATLIETAFGPELAATGSHIVQDLRQMAMLGPFLRPTGRVVAPFAGLVWIEDGRLVGNISLSPEKHDGHVWTVSNVAVLPEYRGRGIGGQLVDAGISLAREREARRLLLQVRADNAVAIGLYRHRGFVTVDTVHDLLLHRYAWPVSVGAPGGALRRPRLADRMAIRALRGRPQPHPVLWQANLLLRYLVTGERTLEVVAAPEGEVVGYAIAEAHAQGGPHEVSLYTRPGRRGRWEAAMLEWLLAHLRAGAARPVRTTISAQHLEALEAAESLGFRTVRVLDQMELDLAPSPSRERAVRHAGAGHSLSA